MMLSLNAAIWLSTVALIWTGDSEKSADFTLFEAKIRPALSQYCYECHSARSKRLQGGLRLDDPAGWLAGGESGKPAVVPGNPSGSALLLAIQHNVAVSPMPPDRPKLSTAIQADFEAWIRSGAIAPKAKSTPLAAAKSDWESTYRKRLEWWSLRPVSRFSPPQLSSKLANWRRNQVDDFIAARLTDAGLEPAPEAKRRTLARRLSFTLVGLPLSAAAAEAFENSTRPDAYEQLVDHLLASSHFGERWARHWMDLVHYADTHGYEWDAPAKNAWMYRDYLIRAFNSDLPYDRFVLEQIAGDLIEPRVDGRLGLAENLIAPMALRLGERRHGDNAAAEGVTQEALTNIIDTVGKTFLATTVACAQCHDHKLDAIAQREYYALAGVFASSRWGVRVVDAADVNQATIKRLAELKADIRAELGVHWKRIAQFDLQRLEKVPAKIPAPRSKQSTPSVTQFPETLADFWKRAEKPPTAEAFRAEQQRRRNHNISNLTLLADFSRDPPLANGWRMEGSGMVTGLAVEGELIIAEEGDDAIASVLPAGRWSHRWSQRMPGALRSPNLQHRPAFGLSIGMAAGRHSAQAVIVDNAFHSERMTFLDLPKPAILKLTIGNFDTLAGGIDDAARRVYLEIATKSLNNYFPPRTAYGGIKESDIADERSWFGVTAIHRHPLGRGPYDDLARFEPLFDDEKLAWNARVQRLVRMVVDRWVIGKCAPGDAALLDEAVAAKLLPSSMKLSPQLRNLVGQYRRMAAQLVPDRTIGSVDDWQEGRNEKIGVRGSYTEFGPEVERGNIRLLGGAAKRSPPESCGRLELAQSIADAKNPLTARVYVNRVWQHLFGQGLVATPDDFGHLGATPSHPELLDYLANRFAAEGWSTKRLIRLLTTSATWRQSGDAGELAKERDPENRLWHHMPMRRLDAESIRDAMLSVSGRLDKKLFGPPIEPHRAAEDPAKRLAIGPLDGNGRRSVYIKMTLMEPPRFLALFNQPIPKLTTGKRDLTNVPNQALALMNDPFPAAMAAIWSKSLVADGARSAEERVRRSFGIALGRPATRSEVERWVRFLDECARLHGVDRSELLANERIWREFAHAMFNLKEFIYVP